MNNLRNNKMKIYRDLKDLLILYEYYYRINMLRKIEEKEKIENIDAKKFVLKYKM